MAPAGTAGLELLPPARHPRGTQAVPGCFEGAQQQQNTEAIHRLRPAAPHGGLGPEVSVSIPRKHFWPVCTPGPHSPPLERRETQGPSHSSEGSWPEAPRALHAPVLLGTRDQSFKGVVISPGPPGGPKVWSVGDRKSRQSPEAVGWEVSGGGMPGQGREWSAAFWEGEGVARGN